MTSTKKAWEEFVPFEFVVISFQLDLTRSNRNVWPLINSQSSWIALLNTHAIQFMSTFSLPLPHGRCQAKLFTPHTHIYKKKTKRVYSITINFASYISQKVFVLKQWVNLKPTWTWHNYSNSNTWNINKFQTTSMLDRFDINLYEVI